MADTKVYSVQPRFVQGDVPMGWSLVEGIFQLGEGIPQYGSVDRDMHLAYAWMNEPMTAGVFSTWVEKIQTVNWKITGGRNQANFYARLLLNADGGRGWTYYQGVSAIDFLSTDKGSTTELGRQDPDSDSGRVLGIQHLDSARMLKFGRTSNPNSTWRYFPDLGTPTDILDDNLIQIISMPSARDTFTGFGTSAMTRILDAKQLMLGYLTYFRQEIGDLPPEMMIIVNNMSSSSVQQSLNKYREQRTQRGNDKYSGLWWLGSDDPGAPVDVKTHALTVPNKSFDYPTIVEWWMKTLSLNVGEAVGEFWLIRAPGNTNTIQSVQAMKAEGKGTGRYLQEHERQLNMHVLPMGVLFEYDAKDDEQDQRRADILATNIGSLEKMVAMAQGEEFVFTIEEIRTLAEQWDVIPQEMTNDDTPTVVASALKGLYDDNRWSVDRNLKETKIEPLLAKYPREAQRAKFVYETLKEQYNGHYQSTQTPQLLQTTASN